MTDRLCWGPIAPVLLVFKQRLTPVLEIEMNLYLKLSIAGVIGPETVNWRYNQRSAKRAEKLWIDKTTQHDTFCSPKPVQAVPVL